MWFLEAFFPPQGSFYMFTSENLLILKPDRSKLMAPHIYFISLSFCRAPALLNVLAWTKLK